MYQPGGIFACAGVDVYDIEHSFGQATYCVYSNIIILLKQAGGDIKLVCKSP
jgi:hypothetical protein